MGHIAPPEAARKLVDLEGFCHGCEDGLVIRRADFLRVVRVREGWTEADCKGPPGESSLASSATRFARMCEVPRPMRRWVEAVTIVTFTDDKTRLTVESPIYICWHQRTRRAAP